MHASTAALSLSLSLSFSLWLSLSLPNLATSIAFPDQKPAAHVLASGFQAIDLHSLLLLWAD